MTHLLPRIDSTLTQTVTQCVWTVTHFECFNNIISKFIFNLLAKCSEYIWQNKTYIIEPIFITKQNNGRKLSSPIAPEPEILGPSRIFRINKDQAVRWCLTLTLTDLIEYTDQSKRWRSYKCSNQILHWLKQAFYNATVKQVTKQQTWCTCKCEIADQ